VFLHVLSLLRDNYPSIDKFPVFQINPEHTFPGNKNTTANTIFQVYFFVIIKSYVYTKKIKITNTTFGA